MHVRRKVIGPTNALTEQQIKWNQEARNLMEHATVDAKDTRSRTVGTCQRMQKRGLWVQVKDRTCPRNYAASRY